MATSERFYVLGSCQAQWQIRALQNSDFNLQAGFLSLATNATNTASRLPWEDALIPFISRLPNVQVQMILSSKNDVDERKIVSSSACNSVPHCFSSGQPKAAKACLCTSYPLTRKCSRKVVYAGVQVEVENGVFLTMWQPFLCPKTKAVLPTSALSPSVKHHKCKKKTRNVTVFLPK